MRVLLSETAMENLRSIRQYYADTSPRYAQRLIEKILHRCEQLSTMPELGAIVEEYGLPQIRQFIESDHRIIYRIGADGIEVLAIRHGAQSWPNN